MSEEFDDIIRQKFAEKEFIFNEANWEKAEIKIDAALKLKKLLLWGSLFSVGLITGICCMFLWKKDKHAEKQPTAQIELAQTTNNKSTIISTTTYNTQSHLSNSSSNANNTLHTEEQLNQNTTIIAKNTSSKKETASSTSGQKVNTGRPTSATPVLNYSTDKKRKTTHSSKEALAHLTVDSREKTINKNEKEQLKNKKEKRSTAEIKDETIKNTVSAKSKSLEKNTKKKTKHLTDPLTNKAESEQADATLSAMNTNASAKKAKQKNTSTGAVKNTKESVKKDALSKNKDASLKNTSAAKNSLDADSTQSTALSDSSLALKDKLQTPAHVTSDSLNDSLKQVVTIDSLEKKKDSIPTISKIADPDASLGLDGLASTNLFFIDAGVNGQVGWKYLNVKEGQGITPVLGISVLHYFNQKWSINVGVNYSSIAYLKTNTFNTVTNYSFGVTTKTSIFKQYILHYIGAPLYINYHVNEKNAIFAGASFSYLANNKVRVQSGQSYTVTPNYTQTTTAGPTEIRSGFYSNLDASISAGYRRKLNSHFSISPVFYFGLTDIKKDALFGLNQFERNSGLKVILSYSIFDF